MIYLKGCFVYFQSILDTEMHHRNQTEKFYHATYVFLFFLQRKHKMRNFLVMSALFLLLWIDLLWFFEERQQKPQTEVMTSWSMHFLWKRKWGSIIIITTTTAATMTMIIMQCTFVYVPSIVVCVVVKN